MQSDFHIFFSSFFLLQTKKKSKRAEILNQTLHVITDILNENELFGSYFIFFVSLFLSSFLVLRLFSQT